MQQSLRESKSRHKIQIANVRLPLTVTPGLQLKHQTNLCKPVGYEINHLEMSERTYNGLRSNLFNTRTLSY